MPYIARELSERLMNDLQDVKDCYDQYAKQTSVLDLTVQDLLHEIENSKFGVVQGYKMLMKLKSTLNQRREVKDQHDLLRTLLDMTAKHQKVIEEANKRIVNKEKQLPNRIYTPRVLKEQSKVN